MGSGPARTLEAHREVRALGPEVTTALSRALQRVDEVEPGFRDAREEERNSQLVKAWNQRCREIDEHLRDLARVLIESHQLALDMGSDGGGRGTRPWLEDTTGTFERLVFRLEDDEVVAFTGHEELLRGPIGRLSYEWVEEAVINWVLSEAERKVGR